jgi:phospholipid-translocating ATPase
MEFKKCAVNGVQYGEGVTEASKGAALREGREASALEPGENDAHLGQLKSAMVAQMKRLYKNIFLQEDKLTLISPLLATHLSEHQSPQRAALVHFFRALALCHSVLADRSMTDTPHIVDYKAESPDEAALVAAARDVGFVFLHKNSLEVDIEVMGQKERWTPLRLLEFNSTRKRMSVIMRGPDNRILLICKGADSVIYQRLRSDHDAEVKDQMLKDLEDFANGGLRTLCIASRYLEEEEFVEWANVYDTACTSVRDREEEIEKACEKIEQDLTLLGATALEDKLQVGVPDTIAKLREAGIKLWIATGDKMQTAIEIGFSCNLLNSDQDILVISADTAGGARTQIETGLAKILQDSDAEKAGNAHVEHAVVIDGQTLALALADDVKGLFLSLSTKCESVICCRVSPAQKAQMVLLVKEGLNAMCLAIGDGANDVSMIQAAHVGVGIAGLEGAQASMSADYAIGQFRFLTKLLLVHGRWCYLRVAVFHEAFFYKNVIWTFPSVVVVHL